MKANQKRQKTAVPSREQITQAVVTSTAIETGQDPRILAETLEEKRRKYAYLRLAV